jgi:hypothetical protein
MRTAAAACCRWSGSCWEWPRSSRRFGLIDGGRRKGQEFWDKTGGVRKMFIRELDAREMKQNAQEKKSKGLTYDDAMALQREAALIELVEPTMERQELVKTAGSRSGWRSRGPLPTTSRCTTSIRPRDAS